MRGTIKSFNIGAIINNEEIIVESEDWIVKTLKELPDGDILNHLYIIILENDERYLTSQGEERYSANDQNPEKIKRYFEELKKLEEVRSIGVKWRLKNN